MPNSKARFIILKIVIAVMFAAVIWKLFDLQVLKGEQNDYQYSRKSTAR